MQQKLFGWIENIYQEHGLKAAIIAGVVIVALLATVAILRANGVDVMALLGG